MTYKECIINSIDKYYSSNELVKFIGYNTAKGSRMYGTLEHVPEDACIETPVCENLMAGMAVGMALAGYKPVLCFERHDFILVALDGIVNHIDKMSYINNYQIKLPIVIRAIVGADWPLRVGVQHKQEYSFELTMMCKYTPVYRVENQTEYDYALSQVGKSQSGAVIIIENRSSYDKEVK